MASRVRVPKSLGLTKGHGTSPPPACRQSQQGGSASPFRGRLLGYGPRSSLGDAPSLLGPALSSGRSAASVPASARLECTGDAGRGGRGADAGRGRRRGGPGRGKQSQRPASRLPGSERAPQPPSALGPAPPDPHPPSRSDPTDPQEERGKSLQNPKRRPARPPLQLPVVTRGQGKEAGRAVRPGRGRGGEGRGRALVSPQFGRRVHAARAARARGGRRRARAAGQPPHTPSPRPLPGGGGTARPQPRRRRPRWEEP